MRQRCLVPVFALVLVITSPAAAVAGEAGWWWWWDSLSGPGEFRGFFIQQSIRTFQKKDLVDPSSPTSYFDPSGLDIDWDRFYFRLSAQGGILFAERNNLQYAPPLDNAPPDVRAIPLMASLDARVVKSVEAGSGVGWVRFSAGESSFWRFALEPHVIWRPLVLANVSERQKGLLELRLYGIAIAQEISASDFGAIGGMESGKEFLFPGLTFTVNVLAIKP
jgi:hypothetical protein